MSKDHANLPCCLQWCAQTIPVCGSYQKNLVGLLLPAVAQAVSAEENGQTQNEALSTVMPQLLQVTRLFSFQMYVPFVTLFACCHCNECLHASNRWVSSY